jgi:hypothetical protein
MAQQTGELFRLEEAGIAGREDVLLTIGSAYESASMRRVAPPSFGPLKG